MRASYLRPSAAIRDIDATLKLAGVNVEALPRRDPVRYVTPVHPTQIAIIWFNCSQVAANTSSGTCFHE